jgi:hypothetical protein
MMRSDMTKKQQKPASEGRKEPAAVGKRIFVKPPDITQTSDADLREFVVDFLRALGGGPDIKGSETRARPAPTSLT